MDTKSQRDITRKLKVLNYAIHHQNQLKPVATLVFHEKHFIAGKGPILLKVSLV